MQLADTEDPECNELRVRLARDETAVVLRFPNAQVHLLMLHADWMRRKMLAFDWFMSTHLQAATEWLQRCRFNKRAQVMEAQGSLRGFVGGIASVNYGLTLSTSERTPVNRGQCQADLLKANAGHRLLSPERLQLLSPVPPNVVAMQVPAHMASARAKSWLCISVMCVLFMSLSAPRK